MDGWWMDDHFGPWHDCVLDIGDWIFWVKAKKKTIKIRLII